MNKNTNHSDQPSSLTLAEVIGSAGFGMLAYFIGATLLAASPAPIPVIGAILSTVAGCLTGYFIAHRLRGEEDS